MALLGCKTTEYIGASHLLEMKELLNFFFPASCILCGLEDCSVCSECLKPLEKAHLKCLRCGKHNPLGVYCASCKKSNLPSRVIAVFRYDKVAKELIHKMKYEDFYSLSEPLGMALAQRLKEEKIDGDFAVSFVPIHTARRKNRGYNQAELLANKVADELGLSCCNLLIRTKKTESQIGLHLKTERRRNIKGAISISNKPPKKIILIDDVITSGATVEESAKILKKNGAEIVIAAALALG